MNHFRPRTRQWIFLFLILCLLLPVSALQAADFFEQGNQAYMRKDYRAAITYYLQAAKKQGFSASLLYNLGNSYARSEKIGPAILAWEQALLLAPTNPDIHANIESIRKANGLYQPNQPWWRRVTTVLGADQWLLLAGISFIFFSSSLMLLVFVRTSWVIKTLKTVAVITLVSTLLALPLALLSYRHWQDGVVLTSTRLKISPFAEAASAGTIQEGQIVTPVKTYKDFVFVLDKKGRKGWLADRELGVIGRPGTGKPAS